MQRRREATSQRSRHVVAWYGRACWEWSYSKRKGCRLVACAYHVPPGEASSVALRRAQEHTVKREEVSLPGSEGSEPKASLGTWSKLYPILGAYCTDTTWDDGEVRTLCWVSLKARAGKWWGELLDPNYLRMLSVEVERPEDVLPALEACLKAPGAPWRPAEWLERFRVKTPKKKGLDKQKRAG